MAEPAPGTPLACEHGRTAFQHCEECAHPAYDLPCPTCLALIGFGCIDPDGGQRVVMHAERRAVWDEQRRFGPHRVIGEFSGDPSCAVCHHAWPCPTVTHQKASSDA